MSCWNSSGHNINYVSKYYGQIIEIKIFFLWWGAGGGGGGGAG